MSPTPGTRLGPYEIDSEDHERLAHFEREAQLLAQLHHPNIASIFGLEGSGGVLALVMELEIGRPQKLFTLPLEWSFQYSRRERRDGRVRSRSCPRPFRPTPIV